MSITAYRPKSFEEFKGILDTGNFILSYCMSCHQEFSSLNVFSPTGWRETQISGLCEKCFDEAMLDENI